MADVDPKAEFISPSASSSEEKVRVGTMGDGKVAPKASAKKKAAVPKPKKFRVDAEHPKYSDMIADAISQLKERRGSSRQAILQYVTSHYNVGSEVNRVTSGSFRLGQRQKISKKSTHPRTPMVKKPTESIKSRKKKSKNPIGRSPKNAAKKTVPAKKAKSPAKKAKSPAKKPKATPKKVKTTASKAKPKSAAKNKLRKPVKKTGKK